MSVESLLQHLSPEVIYRRVPLPDPQNALDPWSEAIAHFVRPTDDSELWDELLDANGPQDPDSLVTNPSAEQAAALLTGNAETLRYLDEGLRRGRLQFPEVRQFDQVAADSELACQLGELAQWVFIRFQIHVAQNHLAAASAEILRLLHMGEMIGHGEGQALHYLVSLWIYGAARRGLQRLAARQDVSGEILAQLQAAVEQCLAQPEGLAQSLRVDFCSLALTQLDRMPEDGNLEAVTDQFLELCRAQQSPEGNVSDADTAVLPFHRQQHERRALILTLLQDHPRPFEKVATARLMGEQVSAMLDHLKSTEGRSIFNLAGHARRLWRALRLRRLERQIHSWPILLAFGLPGNGLGANGGASFHNSDSRHDASAASLSEAQVAATRKALRCVANPVGLILTEYLLTADYSPLVFQHREQMQQTQQMLARRLRR